MIINLAYKTEECLKLWCNDIDKWPQSWAGVDEDIIVGQKIVVEFKAYLKSLIDKGRTKKTVKKHADYLWALGGEIIRDTSENGIDPNLNNIEILLIYVNAIDGPYWRHAYNEKDHQQFDSICRQLYKYILNNNPYI